MLRLALVGQMVATCALASGSDGPGAPLLVDAVRDYLINLFRHPKMKDGPHIPLAGHEEAPDRPRLVIFEVMLQPNEHAQSRKTTHVWAVRPDGSFTRVAFAMCFSGCAVIRARWKGDSKLLLVFGTMKNDRPRDDAITEVAVRKVRGKWQIAECCSDFEFSD